MRNSTDHEEPGLEGDFPGREKQDVFLAASRDGFTAARKIPFQTGRRRIKKLFFVSNQSQEPRGFIS
jgi:hypothetical protein